MPTKVRYKERLSKGLCTSCGQNKATYGTRCNGCRKQELIIHAESNRRLNKQLKESILNHYGLFCHCPGCMETEPLFLEFDHKNNDGSFHRKQIGHGSQALMRWIVKNNFPDSIQVLCANCNQGKRRNNGICPHLK